MELAARLARGAEQESYPSYPAHQAGMGSAVNKSVNTSRVR